MLYHFAHGWAYWDNMLLIGVGNILRSFSVGVDIFFVLSGFLITQILIETTNHPKRWQLFMARRVLRIFPLYYTVMLFAFLIWPYIGNLPDHIHNLWPWYFAYLSNFLMSLLREPYPLYLSVTWSLAVEEQFYLIWPWLVWSSRNLMRCVVGAFIFAQVSKIICAWVFQDLLPVSYFVFCRADEFALGAFLAILEERKAITIGNEKWGIWAIFLALPSFYLAFFLESRVTYPLPCVMVQSVAIGIVAVGLIILNLRDGAYPLIAKFFRSTLLRQFGKHSYCMYLIHAYLYPQFSLLSLTEKSFSEAIGPALAMLLAYFLIVFTLSKGFYYVIEKPFLSLKPKEIV